MGNIPRSRVHHDDVGGETLTMKNNLIIPDESAKYSMGFRIKKSHRIWLGKWWKPWTWRKYGTIIDDIELREINKVKPPATRTKFIRRLSEILMMLLVVMTLTGCIQCAVWHELNSHDQIPVKPYVSAWTNNVPHTNEIRFQDGSIVPMNSKN